MASVRRNLPKWPKIALKTGYLIQQPPSQNFSRNTTMAAIPFSKAEKSYIQTGLALNPPQRPDGRSLHDYRTVALETGVAPLANGSAKLNIGRNPQEGGGGTEIIAATKLEVEDVEDREEDGAVRGVGEGRIVVNVTWFVAYPYSSPSPIQIKS